MREVGAAMNRCAFGGLMIVGAAVIEIHVHESQSLKAKRGVVRSIAGRLRNRFNVSVSEVGGQGTWQRAVIGLSMTGSDEPSLRRALDKAVSSVEEMHLAEVLGSEIEMIRLPISETQLSIGTDGMVGVVGAVGADDGQGEAREQADDLPWSRNLGEREPHEEE